MNWKKIGVYSILVFMLVAPIMSLVLAQTSQPSSQPSTAQQVTDWNSIIGSNAFANVMLYIFGPAVQYEGVGAISAGILTVAVWLLFFITFSDIISTFSTFSKWVSWGIGFLIGVIAANLGWVMKGFVAVTGIFAFLGGIAVYVGLGVAFATFLAANFGLFYIKRMMMRQAMNKEALTDEKGAKRVASAITSLGEAEKALRGVGGK